MKITIAGFQGEHPILDPRLLPENAAQSAKNVYLKRGTLKPHRSVEVAAEIPGSTVPGNLYHYNVGGDGQGHWFSWGSQYDIDVVRSPIANDAYRRIYWTGQGEPKMTTVEVATGGPGPYPSAWYRLGVVHGYGQAGATAPPRTNIPATAVEAVYVYTFVTEFGEEGPPSLPSVPLLRWDGHDDGRLTVATGPAPSGNSALAFRRIYRSESGGQYHLVVELPLATQTFVDDVPSDALGPVLTSLEWSAPSPDLRGLTAMPGGFLAGFFDNTLCFSEAYRPHAWPLGYQLTTDEPIVGIASISSGLVVGTQGRPWLITGISPGAMAPMQLDARQPCVSKRSMVDMGGYAIYASFDGLVAVGGAEARVITEGLLTRDQWLALNPETIRAFRYDGQYLAFYSGGCFAFTPGEGIQFYDAAADGGYYRISNDTLYLIQGSSIVAWNRGAPQAYTWRSKIFEFPPGSASFSCARVVAREYPAHLKIFADGETVLDQSVNGPDMFRLPAGFSLSRDWEIEISGTSEVQSVQIATTPGELI